MGALPSGSLLFPVAARQTFDQTGRSAPLRRLRSFGISCALRRKKCGYSGMHGQRAARSGYQLHHTPQVGAALAARAQSAYGARELRRQVDRAVEQALADRIASGTACAGQHWTADCTADGTVVLREDETATM